VEFWLSYCSVSLVCLVSLSVSSCVYLPRLYDTLVAMEMRWLGYDIGSVVKVGKNIFVVTVQGNYLAYLNS
jgi:hypothetical protein